jgi:hypothetical protein
MEQCCPAGRPKLLRYALTVVLLVALFLPSSAVHAINPAWEPAAPEGGESLVVPFKGGWQAVTTGNAYSGLITLTVIGIGQASGTAFTDAFYVLTDYAGNPVPPTVANGWILAINGTLAKELIPGQQVPAYRSDHSYTFQINAPGGRLTFGVADSYTADNTGSYSVSVAGGTSSCSVPFFSQRDTRWAELPLRTDPQAEDPCDAYCSKIGTCGCTLTSATMLFSYFGAAITPAQVSDCMGIQACPFYWYVGANCSTAKAKYVAQYGFSWQRLDQELNQNHRPVILGMYIWDNIKKEIKSTHFVLVISGKGTDAGGYLVNDPWPLDGANTNLNVLARDEYVFDTLSVYSGTATCSQAAGTHEEIREPIATRTSDSVDVVTGNAWLWHANETSLVVKLSATSSAGQITQMQVWTDSRPASEWQAFSEYTWVTWQPGDRIHAIFRDEFGNVSGEVEDTLHPESVPSNVAQDIRATFLPFITR